MEQEIPKGENNKRVNRDQKWAKGKPKVERSISSGRVRIPDREKSDRGKWSSGIPQATFPNEFSYRPNDTSQIEAFV